MIDVCLVLMPYADIERPSIALGLLKACLQEREIEATAIYPNIWFAEEIGLDLYKSISQSDPDQLMGEWIFSQVAFPNFKTNHTEYFRSLPDYDKNPAFIENLMDSLRKKAESFINRLAEYVVELAPRIVSCSSMFQQHCASLALLRRIRELNPDIITLMGGANCEGPMGEATQREFAWVDFVCSGEGDDLFYKLCKRILEKGRDLETRDLPYGVITSKNNNSSTLGLESPRASAQSLDGIPIPDYDDYFATLRKSTIAPFVDPGLPVETSRGCWWGQKSHCTFCGLNGSGMTYRSKSPERVIKEFAILSERYGIRKFQVVDNILDLKHIKTVIPTFSNLPQGYDIFYETKANLTRSQLVMLAKAGVRWLQPGIESMHDLVLKLMNKGNKTSMNVQFLKWSRELGIRVYWNILMGLPGESDNWYSQMKEWLPLIVHLQPPSCADWIRYDRFSPYHERREDWGLKLSPNKMYSYVYPLSSESLAELAYYFEGFVYSKQTADSSPLLSFHRRKPSGKAAMKKWVIKWINLFYSKDSPILSMVDNGKEIKILDTRPCAIQPRQILSGLAYWIYLTCDRAMTSPEILRSLKQKYQLNVTWDEVKPILTELCDHKIMLKFNDQFLSLALRTPIPELPDNRQSPGGYVDIPKFQEFMKKKLESQCEAS